MRYTDIVLRIRSKKEPYISKDNLSFFGAYLQNGFIAGIYNLSKLYVAQPNMQKLKT